MQEGVLFEALAYRVYIWWFPKETQYPLQHTKLTFSWKGGNLTSRGANTSLIKYVASLPSISMVIRLTNQQQMV